MESNIHEAEDFNSSRSNMSQRSSTISRRKMRRKKDESRALILLRKNEEDEKDLSNWSRKGSDWTEIPSDLQLAGSRGFSYNDNMDAQPKRYADGKRGSGYGSGNGESS